MRGPAGPEHRERFDLTAAGADPLPDAVRGGGAVEELAERVHGEAVSGQHEPGPQQPPPGRHPVLPAPAGQHQHAAVAAEQPPAGRREQRGHPEPAGHREAAQRRVEEPRLDPRQRERAVGEAVAVVAGVVRAQPQPLPQLVARSPACRTSTGRPPPGRPPSSRAGKCTRPGSRSARTSCGTEAGDVGPRATLRPSRSAAVNTVRYTASAATSRTACGPSAHRVDRQPGVGGDDQAGLDEGAEAQLQVAAGGVRHGQRPGRVDADPHLVGGVREQPRLRVVRAGCPPEQPPPARAAPRPSVIGPSRRTCTRAVAGRRPAGTARPRPGCPARRRCCAGVR